MRTFPKLHAMDSPGLRRDMRRLLGIVLGEGGENDAPSVWRPVVDAAEDGSCLRLTVRLPGLLPRDIDVTVVGQRLRIEGRGRETFHRVLDLPDDVAPGEVAAVYQDGVLTITVPKASPRQPRRVEVSSR